MDSPHVRAQGSAGLGPGSRPAVAPLSSRFPGPWPAVPSFHPAWGCPKSYSLNGPSFPCPAPSPGPLGWPFCPRYSARSPPFGVHRCPPSTLPPPATSVPKPLLTLPSAPRSLCSYCLHEATFHFSCQTLLILVCHHLHAVSLDSSTPSKDSGPLVPPSPPQYTLLILYCYNLPHPWPGVMSKPL